MFKSAHTYYTLKTPLLCHTIYIICYTIDYTQCNILYTICYTTVHRGHMTRQQMCINVNIMCAKHKHYERFSRKWQVLRWCSWHLDYDKWDFTQWNTTQYGDQRQYVRKGLRSLGPRGRTHVPPPPKPWRLISASSQAARWLLFVLYYWSVWNNIGVFKFCQFYHKTQTNKCRFGAL